MSEKKMKHVSQWVYGSDCCLHCVDNGSTQLFNSFKIRDLQALCNKWAKSSGEDAWIELTVEDDGSYSGYITYEREETEEEMLKRLEAKRRTKHTNKRIDMSNI